MGDFLVTEGNVSNFRPMCQTNQSLVNNFALFLCIKKSFSRTLHFFHHVLYFMYGLKRKNFMNLSENSIKNYWYFFPQIVKGNASSGNKEMSAKLDGNLDKFRQLPDCSQSKLWCLVNEMQTFPGNDNNQTYKENTLKQKVIIVKESNCLNQNFWLRKISIYCYIHC